jgi:hypothetical protein
LRQYALPAPIKERGCDRAAGIAAPDHQVERRSKLRRFERKLSLAKLRVPQEP